MMEPMTDDVDIGALQEALDEFRCRYDALRAAGVTAITACRMIVNGDDRSQMRCSDAGEGNS